MTEFLTSAHATAVLSHVCRTTSHCLILEKARSKKLPRDLHQLMQSTRKQAWSQLLGLCRLSEDTALRYANDLGPGSERIQQDILRAHCFLSEYDGPLVQKRRSILCDVLNELDSQHQLAYFQGCDSVAAVILAVTDEDSRVTISILRRMSRGLLSEPFQSGGSVPQSLAAMMSKLASVDSHLARFIERSGASHLFAASWLIAGFAHDVDSLRSVARIYDWWFEHASQPDALQWLGVSLLVSHREQILGYVSCEEEKEGTLYSYLKSLPRNDTIDWDAIIVSAEVYRRSAAGTHRINIETTAIALFVFFVPVSVIIWTMGVMPRLRG